MKKEFSKHWGSSSQPRKQRKFKANAPIHIKRKLLSVNLSKDLRKKHNTRNVVVKTGDIVKIMKGKFKGKQGKITKVYTKLSKVLIEKIQATKQDGTKVDMKMQPSNLQIVELNLEDKKRLKSSKKEEVKKPAKEEIKEDKK